MSMRVCAEHGCPTVTDQPRCPDHTRQLNRARGTTTQRGYGTSHVTLRKQWQRRIDAGEPIHCWRPGCGRPITGTAWHLGHDDHDRTTYRGPECVACNTATRARRISPNG